MPLNPVPDPLVELLVRSDVDQLLDSLRTTNAAILCPDTCVFLDFVRNYFQTGYKSLNVLKKLSDLIAQEKALLVIPETIHQEMWHADRGNFEKIQNDQRKLIVDALKTLRGFGETFQQATGTAISLPQEFDESELDKLLDRLRNTIKDLFNRSITLTQTQSVIVSASTRQVERKRPAKANKNSVGDCLIVETLLAFAEGIRGRNVGNPLIFVTSNRDDFSDEDDYKKPHPDLKPDFDRLGIGYSISIQSVLWNL